MLPHWIGFLLCHFLQRLQQHGAACGHLSVNNAGSANAAARIGRCQYMSKMQKICDNISQPMYRSITNRFFNLSSLIFPSVIIYISEYCTDQSWSPISLFTFKFACQDDYEQSVQMVRHGDQRIFLAVRFFSCNINTQCVRVHVCVCVLQTYPGCRGCVSFWQ